MRNANVYKARIFSAVYVASPNGILEELTSKFERARSVLDLIVLQGGHYRGKVALRKVLDADAKLHMYRKEKLKLSTEGNFNMLSIINKYKCPAESAQALRDHMWGRHVESVTMAPLQHLIHIERMHSQHLHGWEDTHHFQYYIHPITDNLDRYKLIRYSSGKRPFLGFTTRNSMVAPKLHFIEKYIVLMKVRNLIDLISWTNVTANDI